MKEFYSKSVTEAIKMETCPQIILPGWWWKKYFASYRRIRVVMQDLVFYNWMHGGYEEYMQLIERGTNMLIDQKYLEEFPPIIFNSKDIIATDKILIPGKITLPEEDHE